MKKLKWHYDNKRKQWYTLETVAWAHDDFSIFKETYGYQLQSKQMCLLFKKLSSAKQVAQLIHNG